MGARISNVQKQKYARYRREGHTQQEAADKANFSLRSAKYLEASGGYKEATRTIFDGTADEEGFGPPKERHQLSLIAQDCLDDFGRFRFRYFGRRSTPWQEEAAVKLRDLYNSDREEYVCLNTPPGGGKTTLFSHDAPAWITCQDRSIRGLLGSHGKVISEGLTGNLRDTFSRRTPILARLYDKQRGWASDALATLGADYGGFKPTNGELWRRNMFTVAQMGETPTAEKESSWVAFSYEARFLGWRVNFINWDDLVTPAMLRNQDSVDALYQWYDDEAETRLEPGGLLVVVGQRLRVNDIYRHVLDKRLTDEFEGDDDDINDPLDPAEGTKKYHHIIYKAHYEDRCKGEHRRNAPAYPEGCLLDPIRIGWPRLRSAKAAGNYNTLWQQEDSDPTKALVRRVWINGGKDVDGVVYEGCWDRERIIGNLPAHIPPGFTLRYVTVDPSPTKWWSIQDWLYVRPDDGTEPLAGYRYLIDLCREKMGANEFLDWDRDQMAYVGVMEDWIQRSKEQGHPITHLIMERNAAQRWAMQYKFFNDWSRSRGVVVLPHDTQKNKSDPELGITALLPSVYRHGRVRLPGDNLSRSPVRVQSLVNEVTLYPDHTTDDNVLSQWFGENHLPDLVATSVKIGTLYPDMPSWMKGR